ncbi:MAG: hypothetical protein EAZ31_07195 [Cytophagia bacterium]|nr:MAG: hypothetical protein EAZ31_07195 [Cytophagia bacterium]
MKKILILLFLYLLSCAPKKQDIILSHHFSYISGSQERYTLATHHYVYAKHYYPRYHNKKHLIGLAKKYFDSVYVKDASIYSVNFVYSNNFEKSFDDTDWGYVDDNYVFFNAHANRYKKNELDTLDVDYYPDRYSWW